MRTKHLLFSAVLFLTACGGAASSEDESSSDQDLSGNAISPGYYIFDKQEGSNDRWVEQMNLHVDGSYEANFGDDVSNLSGLHFVADGTYKINTKTKTISFSQGGGAADPYGYRVANGALELKFIGDALSPQNWFSVAKQPSPVTLTFGADWSATESGPLRAGGTALVRYAASRAQCTGAQADTSLNYIIDGGTSGNEFFGEIFPSAPVNGFVDLLVTIPEGHDLAFYFKSSDDGCNHVDSNFGKNYHFAIQK